MLKRTLLFSCCVHRKAVAGSKGKVSDRGTKRGSPLILKHF